MNARIQEILDSLLKGQIIISPNDNFEINNIVIKYLNNEFKDLNVIYQILEISNILYNNTDRMVLPLEDGVYDMVVRKYDNETNGGAPVGAPPVIFHTEKSIIGMDRMIETEDDKVQIATIINPTDMHFYQNLIMNDFPNRLDYIIHDHIDIPNQQTKITHSYPELVGTIRKCNFIFVDDLINAGLDDDDPTAGVFERDFLRPTWNIASSYQGNEVELVAELKYDGVSVEAEICNDIIISACSRGDTANDVATDLTPIFGGYKFHRATANGFRTNGNIGIKFECIITKTNLARLENDFGISYKNARVAVTGILGRLDAIKFRDYLTLVPIKSSGLLFPDIRSELDFLNANYSSGVYMRYAIIRGDYTSIMNQVKQFVDEAEYMRDVIDFMYDGVVISYSHPMVRQSLGRFKDKDMFSMAIKFNPMSKPAYFIGYTYTIGQDGRVTPMAHFTPVEFFGTIHDKTTAHSYKRFVDLDLRKGDIVQITYRNDVICYISKPDVSYNQIRAEQIPPIEFPTHCPFCGSELQFSVSGDSVYCPNKMCPERMITKTSNMLKKMGILGFRKSMIRKLNVHNLTELLKVDPEFAAEAIGDGNASNLFDAINTIKTTRWNDYRLIGAIGFTGISEVRWKTILNKIPINKIISMDDDSLRVSLGYIKGIGTTMINTIIEERKEMMDDLITITSLNLDVSYGIKTNGPKVRFSGVRDKALVDEFRSIGFDADGDKTVTKDTFILVIPHHQFTSNKVTQMNNVKTEHYIMTVDEAKDYITKIKINK